MIKELLYKWFGLSDECKTCEVLKEELAYTRRHNELLMDRLSKPIEVIPKDEPLLEMQPIKSKGRYIPHAVRQQMMESEDRKTLEIMQKKNKELADLEKEVLGKENDDASKVSEAV